MSIVADFPLSHLTAFSFRGTGRFVTIQLVIAAMTNILSLALPIMMLQIYDRIIPHQAYGTLAVLATGVLVALILDSLLRTIRAWLTGWVTSAQENAAGCAAMSRFCNADMPAFSDITTGTHLQNMNALTRLREFYSGQALTALIDLPFVCLFLGLIAYLGHSLVFVPLALLGIFLITAIGSGRHLKDALERRAEQDNYKSSYLVTILTSVHTIKAFAMEMFALRGFDRRQKHIARESYRVALASGDSMLLGSAFSQLSLIATATVGVLLVLDNGLSVGGLSACTLLAGRTIQPVQRVLGTWLRLQDLTIAKEQATQLFSLPVQERTTEYVAQLRGDIALNDLSFSYSGRSIPLLSHVNLSITAGDVIAISGDKGSGKSTLLQVIAGLLIPTQGRIVIDGYLDPATCNAVSLSHHIAYLPQRATIFKGTLLENMTGFRNDHETIAAAKDIGHQLGLDNVVNSLSKGYQTTLADSPADPVPPGVKQRIGLARALLYQPNILLFDDADRALDKEGYNLLFRLMGRLKGRCTMIIVSHDQNLLSFADQFYHLSDGVLSVDDIKPSQRLTFLTQHARG